MLPGYILYLHSGTADTQIAKNGEGDVAVFSQGGVVIACEDTLPVRVDNVVGDGYVSSPVQSNDNDKYSNSTRIMSMNNETKHTCIHIVDKYIKTIEKGVSQICVQKKRKKRNGCCCCYTYNYLSLGLI